MLACAIFINSASNPKNSPTNHRSPPPSQHPPKPNCPSQLVCQKRSTGHAPTSRPVPSLFQLKSVLADRAGPAGFEPPERDSAEIFPETQNTRRNAWRVYRVRNRAAASAKISDGTPARRDGNWIAARRASSLGREGSGPRVPMEIRARSCAGDLRRARGGADGFERAILR